MQLFWLGLFYNPFQMQNDKNPASAGFFYAQDERYPAMPWTARSWDVQDEPYTAKLWMARAVFFQRSQILMDYHGIARRV